MMGLFEGGKLVSISSFRPNLELPMHQTAGSLPIDYNTCDVRGEAMVCHDKNALRDNYSRRSLSISGPYPPFGPICPPLPHSPAQNRRPNTRAYRGIISTTCIVLYEIFLEPKMTERDNVATSFPLFKTHKIHP